MQKRIVEGVEVQRSSGNVFADLGLPDAEKLKIKTGLVVEIRKAIRALGINQQAAAKRMGIPQPKVSGMMRGDFTNLSERKLMDCLNLLRHRNQGTVGGNFGGSGLEPRVAKQNADLVLTLAEAAKQPATPARTPSNSKESRKPDPDTGA